MAQGNPSNHYQAFTRNMRDFSPQVARRIEHFESSYEVEAPEDGEPESTFQRSVIEAGLLAEAQSVSMTGAGEYVGQMSDGSQISVAQEGDHITRSISVDGVDYPV